MVRKEMSIEITSGDFLAGGGGVTEAMTKIPGLKCKWVLNHDHLAIRTNIFNHKNIKHYWSDIYNQDEHDMDMVDFIWASIECTQHSRANGGKEKKIGSYTLGWELVRYIKYMMPLVIGIENVPEFKEWGITDEEGKPIKQRKGEEFQSWKETICKLGYTYHERIMNAADYGIPTRRIRFFCFFTRDYLRMSINWPVPTHNKLGINGLKKWQACKDYIDLEKQGESIFGREFNPNVRKGKRTPLSPNTLRRIAGGIRKFAPELHFIFQYYGTGDNCQSVQKPLNTITTKDRHVLVHLEKVQFVQDYCRQDIFNKVDDPLSPQLTRQTKQLVTIEKKFITKYFNDKRPNGNVQVHASDIKDPFPTILTVNRNALVSVNFITDGTYSDNSKVLSPEDPINTITGQQRHQLMTVRAQFISKQYNSNGRPELNNQPLSEPLGTLTTEEKVQFITAYFNSSGNPGSQNQCIGDPLNTILTGTNKKALITAIRNGEIDFDIRMRFLDPEELSRISTFPERYFTHPRLKLSKKDQTKLIGNAVPPEWARLIIEPVIKEMQEVLSVKQVV